MIPSRIRIGANVRRLRVSLGLTLETLSMEVGVGLSWLSKLELGRQNPGVDIVDQLAQRLGVDPVALYVAPIEGEAPPAPLKAGRKPKSR